MANRNGRPRDARIDDAVLGAVADLLLEVGYADLTVAAVAERAGTSRPAVYRRWPTKAELVLAAFIEGVSEDIAREAFRLAAAKLSVTTNFVTRTVR